MKDNGKKEIFLEKLTKADYQKVKNNIDVMTQILSNISLIEGVTKKS
jgi:hypothetical protein